MRVLFLDLDGVLNSESFWRADGPLTSRSNDDLGIKAVYRLNRVLRVTGAKVVISSSWRVMMPLSEITDCLWRAGFVGDVVGQTPDLSRASWSEVPRRMQRGDEIQQWLDEHPEVTQFAIVDDDADMVHLTDRLVRTDVKTGLTFDDAERLIQMFGQKHA